MRAAQDKLMIRALAVAVVTLLAAGLSVLQRELPAPPNTVVLLDRGTPDPVPELPAGHDVAQATGSAPLVPPQELPTVEPVATPAVVATPTPTPLPAPVTVQGGGPTFPARIKGVWVHVLDSTVLTRAGIERMLDNVAAAGGNTVVVEVARRYDAYYDSAFLPRGNDAGFEPGLDVLQATIDGARARGLSVHAWFTAMPAWTPETANTPAPVNWTYAQHGLGGPEDQRWLTRSSSGEWGDYLDPGHPDVQNLVVATAAELAAYDVDAVHVDYLRYPGADYGYNPVALGRFQAETGRTDIPAPDDPQFGDWRRQQTTDIARRMREAVHQVNPDVGISAALITWGNGPVDGRTFEQTPAWTQVFQPWPQWMAEGLVDVAMPMMYFRESRHAHYHRNWASYVAGLRNATGVMVAPGQGSWLNTVEETLVQLTDAAPFMDGEVLFSYQETAAGAGPEALLGPAGALRAALWGP